MMKRGFGIVLAAMGLVSLLAFAAYAQPDCRQADWQWKSSELVAGSSGIVHTVWELARPPYGVYDKIALHRFAYKGKDIRKRLSKDKVMFHLPGTWDVAWRGISAPEFENHIYFAENGYDVFSMDYRVSYLPNLPLDRFDHAGTAQWTYGAFREDIKACVEKAKKIAKARKVFMSGFSRGGTQMWIFASKYWQEDLKGLIGLDGGPPFASTAAPRTPEQYQAAIDAFLAGGEPLLTSGTTYSGYNRMQHAALFPDAHLTVGYDSIEACLQDSIYYQGAPPDGSTVETAGDLLSYFYFYAWGPAMLTNYYGKMIDQRILLAAQAGTTLYWPGIQNVEIDTDPGYGDHVAEIDLPVIFFMGNLTCGRMGAACANPEVLPIKCASTDVTIVPLTGFGHMDVMWGNQSEEKVKAPLLEWMNDRQH